MCVCWRTRSLVRPSYETVYPLLPAFLGLLACCLISLRCHYFKVGRAPVVLRLARRSLSFEVTPFTFCVHSHTCSQWPRLALFASQHSYKDDNDEPLVYGLLARDADLLRCAWAVDLFTKGARILPV
jgi:hypothetical protein